jgi:4-hydroxythreonine-4-phosphate dehydrogenase
MKAAHHGNQFVAMTIGDINGIGPEIVLKSLQHVVRQSAVVPLLVGPLSVFSHYARMLGLPLRFERVLLSDVLDWQRSHISGDLRTIPVIESSPGALALRPGRVSRRAGKVASQAIETAVTLVQMGAAGAMVTAPVSKRAMHKAGITFSGQTELLQSLTRSPRAGMMMVSPTMRIGLVTIHVPLQDIVGTLSQRLLLERIRLFHHALITDWGIPHPRMAVLGLNPHAGEEGDLGTQEQRLISPALHRLQEDGFDIAGPFPADGFFSRYQAGTYDAVIAMYHDQGLIPLKMTAHGRAVNVTAGLPVVRTSPAHGTAFDIAGKLTADPKSMIESVRVALQIAAFRQGTGRAHAVRARRGKKVGRKRR